MNDDRAHGRSGLLLGSGAYLAWGVLPLYFKALSRVPPVELVAQRICWSLLFLALLALAWTRGAALRAALANRKVMAALAATSVLIATNWLVYIWAVLNGHVLEGSLGYFLNPLVNVLLGVALLKEKLSRLQIAAVACAACGVALLAFSAAAGLWISLALAFSFASYGFLRKVAPVDSLEGLTIETAILTPAAIAWVVWLQLRGEGSFGADRTTDVLLVLSGAVTATPLLLFAAAAKRLAYSTLGFLQYIAPSLQFLLAVAVFGERLTTAHIVCFAAIWTALILFVFENWRMGRADAHEREPANF